MHVGKILPNKNKVLWGLLVFFLLGALLGLTIFALRKSKAASTAISNCTQLQEMSLDLAADYVVTQSFSCSDIANFSPIGTKENPFTGSFDGGNYEISNLTIDRPDANNVGLFGYVGGSSKISNVKLVNVNVTGRYQVGGLVGLNHTGTITNCSSTGSVTGSSCVGGLVGLNGATTIANSYATGDVVAAGAEAGGLAGESCGPVINSYATGNVVGDHYVGGLAGLTTYHGDITNSYATGNVTGTEEVGGLVGESTGLITNSYATGNVTGTEEVGGLVGDNSEPIINSYATGNVVGDDYVGGLAGYNSEPITNSYASGSVTGTEEVGGLVGSSYKSNITNSYASGSVTGNSDVGGLVGRGYNDTVTNAYWDKETTGQEHSAGSDDSYGKTTAEMKTQSTYEPGEPNNWDFTTIWAIVCSKNKGYPYLRWQTLPLHPCDGVSEDKITTTENAITATSTPAVDTATAPTVTILPKTGK
ncbi:MAG TPA: GLUG motif-containing protein [bacterium]|jgi:hypothetical protein|nr:GLUG motif-containing protein [bacterium]